MLMSDLEPSGGLLRMINVYKIEGDFNPQEERGRVLLDEPAV